MLQRDERCTVLLREFPLEAAWCAVLWTLAAESEEDWISRATPERQIFKVSL
jgi:hypothetical protein